jgi:hypothetical protein
VVASPDREDLEVTMTEKERELEKNQEARANETANGAGRGPTLGRRTIRVLRVRTGLKTGATSETGSSAPVK